MSRIDPAVANILLDACEVIELQSNEKRAALERESVFNDKLNSLVESLGEKGILSPEKRAYLQTRVGLDNLEVLTALEKSASSYSEDTSLGGPSNRTDAGSLDPIAKFAMS